jgi:hypothetical protein
MKKDSSREENKIAEVQISGNHAPEGTSYHLSQTIQETVRKYLQLWRMNSKRLANLSTQSWANTIWYYLL